MAVTAGFMAGSIVAKLVLDKSGWNSAMADVVRQNQRTAAGAEQLAGSLRQFGVQMAMLGGAIVGVAAVAVNSFTKFNDAMSKSLAIMGDDGAKLRHELEAVAKEVARTTTVSSEKAAAAYYFLSSAGLSAQESMKALPAVAKFAQAGMFDLELATTLLADAQSALGLRIRDDAVKNMENMVRVSDVLSKANILANGSIQDFSEALTNRAAPALRMVGKDVEEGVAALAIMANAGIKGAEAGTRLDIVLRDLQTRTLNNKAAFEKYNVTVFDSAGEMRNLADIVGELEVAMKGQSDEKRRSILMEMDFQDRSVASIMSLIGFSKELRNMEKELRKAKGTTEEIAKKQLESLKSQLQLTKNEMNLLAEAIGKSLAPQVEALNSALRWTTKHLTDLVDGNTTYIGVIGTLATALGVLALAFGAASIGAAGLLASQALLLKTAPMLAAYFAQAATALGALGAALLALVVGGLAYGLTRLLSKLTGFDKVLQWWYGLWISVGKGIGKILGIGRKELELTAGATERAALRTKVWNKALELSNGKVKNYAEALRLLQAEWAKSGDLGSTELNTLAAKWAKNAAVAEETRKKTAALYADVETLRKKVAELTGYWPTATKGTEDFGTGLSRLGAVVWELGKSLDFLKGKAAETGAAVADIWKTYDLKTNAELQRDLRAARAALDQLMASTEKTPGQIKKMKDAIAAIEEEISGVTPKYTTFSEAIDTLTEAVAENATAWEKAVKERTGWDIKFEDFDKYMKTGEGPEGLFSAEFELKLNEETWEESWAQILSETGDKSLLLKGVLGDLLGDLATAGFASSEGIRTAMESLTKGGTLSEVSLRIEEVKQALLLPGLTTERYAELSDELERLQKIAANTSPWGRFVSAATRAVDKVSQAWSMLSGVLSDIAGQIQTNAAITVENEYQTRLAYINKTITDETKKQEAISALEAEYQVKKDAAQRKGAALTKGIALMNAIVNTAVAVTNALALSGPPWVGIVMAALVGAMGAVQVGLIAAQPTPLAEGAAFDEPTRLKDVLIGEAGPEYVLPEKKLVRIVRDAFTLPRFSGAPALAPALAGAGGGGPTIQFNGPLVSTTGVSRRDLEAAGEQMAHIVSRQLRRVGRKI
jgi:TP901 family phage tail tape measure protein